MEITFGQLLQFMAIPVFLLVGFWFLNNRKKLPSKWNLFWHRAKAVKVNFITRSGRNIEKIVVPDARGMMKIDGGSYPYLKEASVINADLRIPEITLSQSQPYPAIPEFIEVKLRTKVRKPKEGGGFIEEDGDIPGHLVSFHNVKSLKLAGKVAEEYQQMLGSKIVDDIVKATSKRMEQLELMFYIVIAILIVDLIGHIKNGHDISQLGSKVDGVLQFVGSSHK